mgnify:CR=1 FL=1
MIVACPRRVSSVNRMLSRVGTIDRSASSRRYSAILMVTTGAVWIKKLATDSPIKETIVNDCCLIELRKKRAE